MKSKGFLMLLVLLGAVLSSLPALAGAVSMSQNYDLTLTFTGPGGTVSGGTVSANAYYIKGFDFDGAFPLDGLIPGGSANAVAPVTSIFTQTQATTTSNSSSSFTLFQAMAANGPVSDTISQYTNNWITFEFLAPGAGDYTATLSGTYTGNYALTGNEVSTYTSFTDVTWYSKLSASFNAGDNLLEGVTDSLSTEGLPPFYLANYSMPVGGSFSWDLGSLPAGVGDPISLSILLESSLEGTTSNQVPVPASLVLLGSGLAGMLVAGRRRFFRH